VTRTRQGIRAVAVAIRDMAGPLRNASRPLQPKASGGSSSCRPLSGRLLYAAAGFKALEEVSDAAGSVAEPLTRMGKTIP